MNLEFCTDLTEKEFDQIAAKCSHHNLYQTSAWAHVKQEWGHRYVAMKADHVYCGAAMILLKPLPMGLTMAYIPRGPLVDFNDEEKLQYFLKQLQKYCRTLNAIECKFDPFLIIGEFELDQKAEAWTATSTITAKIEQCKAEFVGYTQNLAATIQPRFQLCFTHQENWEEVMPKKTREKIHTSFAKGVEIKTWDISHVHQLAQMIEYTEKRKNIHLRNEDYFRTLMEAYGNRSCILAAQINVQHVLAILEEKKIQLFSHLQQLDEKANKKKKQIEKQLEDLSEEIRKVKQQASIDGDVVLISALLLVHDGTTCDLLYSGLNEQYRRYLAAYGLRYKAMEWAFNQGCTRFNFGGVEGSLDDGLFTFKSSFHPHIDVYIGEFSLPCLPVIYPIWTQFLPRFKQWRRNRLRRNSQ